MDELVLISAIIVAKGKGKRQRWFITKDNEDWEFPKTIVRKVESSVRASIRSLGEKALMTVQVIEEAGRVGGVITINDKTSPKRVIYYVAIELSSGEMVGFKEHAWLPYASAIRKLTKQEQVILRSARKELIKWEKAEDKKAALLKEAAKA